MAGMGPVVRQRRRFARNWQSDVQYSCCVMHQEWANGEC